ncbi:uncharacterized protein PHACADRAFT_262865 [Phanerochaete carnosa HHB-10118-sp]|uniref:Uncharacterized protein n=1 Tax=Phanerochaete carnosa (strain HHB-10118-sp) TaxID=650164 RepID=K5VI72_PHACS|nr:uncharacterized protein PHACADRAFT_262865 [Phanerochaete carnosa HHB-10118-sp]EKM50958.1 hypothetical protein PHACADRAFT_262865 [Phanerochaete carnosa HHB-10118-sp]
MQANTPISPDPYLGPYLIGTVVTAIFFGMLCLQCCLFFRRTAELQEGWIKRALIASIWFLNAFNLFSLIWLCYAAMVTNFGDLRQLLYDAVNWKITVTLICTAWSNGIVQGWLVWRIWICSGKNRSIITLLGFGVVTTCCLITALAGKR